MTRVLVVDDEPQLLELLALTLRLRGYQVNAAASGEAALTLARAQPFDVAVLDVMMPGLNGFDTAARMRELPCPPRILFLTGLSGDESAARGLSLGAAYLTKPFRPADLLAMIQALTVSATGSS